MSLFRLFARRSVRPVTKTRLRMESLEAREVPAVDLLAIANSEFPSNKPLFVPVTATTADGPVGYSVTSNDGSIKAELVTTGRNIRFTVSGKDANNVAFNGTLTIRLFEDIAPLATGNIINLVRSGYYDGKEFHRIVNDFVIQGGSPNGDGQGGSSLVNDVRDEYHPEYTFASRGIVAMANAGDDNNNSQFFITDPFIVEGATEVDAPLDRRSQFLNFNHTIVGILTEGFDTYQKIMNVPKVLGSDGAVSKPVNDVRIEDAKVIDSDTDRNALLKISALNGFLGSAVIKVDASEGGEIESKTFTVTSVADTVNDRPFLGMLSNLATTIGVPVNFQLPFTELDSGDTPTFVVGRVVNTANGPVFTTLDPTQGTATVNQDGRVTFTPASGFTGDVTLSVGVRDAQDRIGSSLGLNDARNFDTEKITVSVSKAATNTEPTISEIADQTVIQGQSKSVSFTVGDAQTSLSNLTVVASSSNTTLLPASGVSITGTGATRTINVTPAAGQTGTSTVTVTVRDEGGLFKNESFVVTVTDSSGNTAPTITAIADQTSIKGRTNTVNFTIADTQTEAASLSVTAASSNSTLFPAANISVTGTGASRSVTLTPAAGQTGTATITVTVTDGGGLTATETYTISVTDLTVTLTSSKNSTTVGDDVLLSAVVTANAGTGNVQFFNGTTSLGLVPVIDNKALLPVSFPTAGNLSLSARFVPANGTSVDSSPVTVAITADGTPPVSITAVGQTAGTLSKVVIRNSDGTTRHTVDPYPTFKGLISVKVGDVNNDGQLDVVAVPGFGGGPLITVYDGDTGKLIYQKMIYETHFRGGLSLDVGDAKGLGYAQILVGAGNTGGPRVTLLDASNDKVLLNYFAYDNKNRGGVTVAISDLRGGNQANIITGAGIGLAPNVNVYNPFSVVGFETPSLFGTFVAGDKTKTTGIRVGAGPLIDNNRRDVLVGPVDNTDTISNPQSFNPYTQGIFVGPANANSSVTGNDPAAVDA